MSALGGSFSPEQYLPLDDKARKDGPKSFGRKSGSLEMGRDQRVHGGIEQRL